MALFEVSHGLHYSVFNLIVFFFFFFHNLISFSLYSFDIVRDSLGLVRSEFPHTAYFVAGTQVREFFGGVCKKKKKP